MLIFRDLLIIMDLINKYKFLRYGVSGLTALCADYCSFLLFYYVLHLPLLLSNSFSFLLGFTISFSLNRNWTFKSMGSYKLKAHHQLVLFFSLSIFNLLFSNIIIFTLNKRLLIAAAIAKLITVSIIACWNYLILKMFIFKEIKEA